MAQETSAKENNTNVKQTATTPVLIYQSRQHCLHVMNFKIILLASVGCICIFIPYVILFFFKHITYTILLFHSLIGQYYKMWMAISRITILSLQILLFRLDPPSNCVFAFLSFV